jgi:hypothetical protein
MSQFTCGFKGSDFAAEKQNFLSLSSRWLIVLHCVKHQIQIPALYESDTESHGLSHGPNKPAGRDLLAIRTIPTSPDHSVRLPPPHNPSVVGSIPTGRTEAG